MWVRVYFFMTSFRFEKAVMLLLISVILTVTFFHLTRDIRDHDFFWHLKTGQWIWENKDIPAEDPFSFTTEKLQSVREKFIMSSYWLSQTVFWLFYSAAGMGGIVLLRFILVGILIAVMIRRKEGDSVIYVGLLLLFLSMLLSSYPVERPHIFSFLFFALLLHLLRGRKGSGAAASEGSRYGSFLHITLPLLMLTWANMHAGYIVGAAVIALYAAFEGFKFFTPELMPMQKNDYKILLTAGSIGLFASFVNPNTWHVFSENILFQYDHITYNNIEFQSTIRIFKMFHDHSVIIYWLMLFLTAAGLLINRKKTDITEAALLAVTGYFSFTSIRYIAFFMIAALPVASRIFSEGKLIRPARTLILAGSLFTGVFFTWDHLSFENLSSGKWIDEQKFPVAAADFILANNINGNMYNYFNWGGYLIWRLAPERKVFIDGRTLYSRIYLQSDLIDPADERRFGDAPAWKAALDEHNIRYTITPASLPLVKALYKDREWIPVFSSNNSVIFVRNTVDNRDVIEKNTIDKRYNYCNPARDSKRDHLPD